MTNPCLSVDKPAILTKTPEKPRLSTPATHIAMIQTRLPSPTRSRLFHLGLALLTALTLLSAPTSARAGEDFINISPDRGPVAGGNTVQILLFLGGSPSINSVTFGGQPAMYSRIGNTLTLTAPPSKNAGPVTVVVNYSFDAVSPQDETETAASVPTGLQVSAPYTYEASAAPEITSVSPPTTPAVVPTVGVAVTLTGTNLSGITGILGFGDLPIPVTAPSANSLTFTIPAGTYPVGPVRAAVTDGVLNVPFSFTFTRVGNPVLTLNRIVPGSTPNNVGLITLRAPSGTFTALTPAAAATQTSKIRPGTVVTLIAAAKSGSIFSSWGGEDSEIGTTSGRSFSFTMPDDDVTLDAEFIANPFASLAGIPIFRGVLSPFEAPSSNATHGSVRVTLSKTTGDFSGNFFIDGRDLPIRGYILGDDSVWFIQGPATAPVTSKDFTFASTRVLNMSLQSVDDSLFLDCTIDDEDSDGVATLQLTSIPTSVFNRASTATGPIDQGYFTAALSPSGIDGDCPAFITISNTGRVSVIGSLADGSSLTMSTNLCEPFSRGLPPIGAIAALPLHSQLRTPGGTATQLGGSLLGTALLNDAYSKPLYPSDSAVAGDSLSVALSITGVMTWIRPTVTQVTSPPATLAIARATQIYTAGWPAGMSVYVNGTQYDGAITVQNALQNFGPPIAPADPVTPPAPGNAVLDFAYGKLSPDLSFNSFNILGSTFTKIIPINRNYTLTLTQRTGQIGGSFTPNWTPRSSLPTTFTGVIIQSTPFLFGRGPSGGYGTGFFISNQPGDLDPLSGDMSLRSAANDS